MLKHLIPRTLSVLCTVSLTLGATTANAAFRFDEATIAEIHAAMKSGELTARRLVEMYLERIAAYDQSGPAINAVILVNPNAIARAEKLDEQFARAGLSGSLHGIPVLLKDNVETGDMPTTGGSLALEGHRPKADAFPRLRGLRAEVISVCIRMSIRSHGAHHVSGDVIEHAAVGEQLPVDLYRRKDRGNGHGGQERLRERALLEYEDLGRLKVRRHGAKRRREVVEVQIALVGETDTAQEEPYLVCGVEPTWQRETVLEAELDLHWKIAPILFSAEDHRFVRRLAEKSEIPIDVSQELTKLRRRHPGRIGSADEASHARSRDVIDRNPVLFEPLEDADVGDALGAAASES